LLIELAQHPVDTDQPDEREPTASTRPERA
jgi:hypothetical protein